MQFHSYRRLGLLALALIVPFGCGKDDGANGATAGNAGMAGMTGGGNRGGSGGSNQGTSGSAPTGCEGLMPMTGDECDDTGLVCPNPFGSCVCQRGGGERSWECFEIGGGEAGSSSAGGAGGTAAGSEGGASQGEGGAAGGEGGAAGGEGGAAQGGDTNGGAVSAGVGGAD